MNKIIIDLSTSSIFANASKFVELIAAYQNENYEISIIKKNWKKLNFKGVKYNNEEKKYSKSTGNYIWDPGIHPDDYFENLVFSSFDLKFEKELSFIKKKFFLNLKEIIFRIIHVYRYVQQKEERKMITDYYYKSLKENLSIKNFISYVIKIIEFKLCKHIKILPKKFVPFRYILSKEKN